MIGADLGLVFIVNFKLHIFDWEAYFGYYGRADENSAFAYPIACPIVAEPDEDRVGMLETPTSWTFRLLMTDRQCSQTTAIVWINQNYSMGIVSTLGIDLCFQEIKDDSVESKERSFFFLLWRDHMDSHIRASLDVSAYGLRVVLLFLRGGPMGQINNLWAPLALDRKV